MALESATSLSRDDLIQRAEVRMGRMGSMGHTGLGCMEMPGLYGDAELHGAA